MPILKYWRWGLPLALLMAVLAYCHRGSLEYRHILTLPETQWDTYAQTLPVERRLDLNFELDSRFGHNPPTIELAFADKPLDTYKAITKRLKNGDRRRAYSSILLFIDGTGGFNICDQPDRRIVQSYLMEMNDFPDGHQYGSSHKFYTC